MQQPQNNPPPDPGLKATSGKTLRLKMRVYRAKEGRWYDLPEEVHTIEGEPK